MAATSFTLFPMLPVEIRDQIWKAAAALPVPRTILLSGPYGSSNTPIVLNNCDIPTPLFQVNYEARQVAEKAYPICFSQVPGLESTRFNSSRDSLAFRNSFEWVNEPDSVSAEDFAKTLRNNFSVVQNIILDFSLGVEDWVNLFKMASLTMQNIQTVAFLRKSSLQLKKEDIEVNFARFLKWYPTQIMEEYPVTYQGWQQSSVKSAAFFKLSWWEMQDIPGMAVARQKAHQMEREMWNLGQDSQGTD
jgi:hypothetical protein